VKATPQRGTAKAGHHAFSARSGFLTIRAAKNLPRGPSPDKPSNQGPTKGMIPFSTTALLCSFFRIEFSIGTINRALVTGGTAT